MPGDVIGYPQNEPLNCTLEAYGRSYKVLCGSMCAELPAPQMEAWGRVQPQHKGEGIGTICTPLWAQGHGSTQQVIRGQGHLEVCFPLVIAGYGQVTRECIAQGSGTVQVPIAFGSGSVNTPISSTYDLIDLLGYIGNFLPELEGYVPSPLPPQDRVRLDVLEAEYCSFARHNDRRRWMLMSLNYCGSQVMLMRNTPSSLYPMRHVTNPELYKSTILYLSELWAVRPNSIRGSLKTTPLTNRQLEESRRGLM